MQSLTGPYGSDPRRSHGSGEGRFAPVASATFERLAGRPPAYYSRRLRALWTVWRRPALLCLVAVAFGSVGFAEAAKPLRASAMDAVHTLMLAAGLRVGEIVIEGESGIPDADVIEAISPFGEMALPFFDADAARERILSIPRVHSATVMKLYPDTLYLRIIEREPFGLWQRGGDISVIDREGRVVRQRPDAEQAALPLFVGEGANVTALSLEGALEAAPAVRSRVGAAVRIADRRWDLKLDNGVAVQLPEADIARAVGVLATMLKQPGFFDQPIRVIDLRLADRVTLTLTEDGALARRTILQQRAKGIVERQT